MSIDWIDPNWRYEVSNQLLGWSAILLLTSVSIAFWRLLRHVYARRKIAMPIWVFIVAGMVVGGALGGAMFLLFNRANQPVAKRPAWNADSREDLTSKLKSYASADANVKVLFSSAQQRPTADLLVSVFSLAGWRTDLTTVPLDRWLDDSGYFDGIEVRGYNQHLVESISNALTAAGLPRVRGRTDVMKVKTSNPKWSWANRRIKITIGHEEPSQPRNTPIGGLDALLQEFRVPLEGLSSPSEKPTPESDANPTEYFLLRDGRNLRMVLPRGGKLTAEQRQTAADLIDLYESELTRSW